MPGLTPYRKIPFPLIGEVISDATIKSMASTMDSVLATSQSLSTLSRHKSSFYGVLGGSVVKNTDTYTISQVINWDTGASGPGGTPFWAVGNPTRITAPVSGLYLYSCSPSTSFNDPPSATQYTRALMRVNGTTVRGWDQCAGRISGVSAYGTPQLKGMIPLTAGQYIEFGLRWNSAEAGPLSMQADCYVALMAVQ